MRLTATGMLALMAGLFLWSRQFVDLHPAWGYVNAFAEAAMVGGLADWFAVTALFRHPLGLPIPHTAIIPENKERIADTMAQFLRENFLIPAVVARRMGEMNLADALGRFLADPQAGAGSRIRAGAGDMLVEVLESLDPERLGGQVSAGLKTQLEKLEISPLLGQMLSAAIADRRHLPLMESLIRWSGLVIEDNEELIRAMIHERANGIVRWTGLDERVANSVLDGLYRLLAEVLVDPDHPLRGKVQEGLEDLAERMQNDPEMRARVERLKREMLANPALGDWWQGVWERLRGGLIRMLQGHTGAPDGLGSSLAELGEALQRDARLQHQVNRFARRTAVGVASRYGDRIVQLVSATVRRWDAQTITDRVEGAVGRDLQFIRINGTLVGGLVGVGLHALDGVL